MFSKDISNKIGLALCFEDCSSAYGLGFHLLGLADDFVWCTLHDTAGFGELGADTHEVSVDITSGLATFVDAPIFSLAMVQ